VPRKTEPVTIELRHQCETNVRGNRANWQKLPRQQIANVRTCAVLLVCRSCARGIRTPTPSLRIRVVQSCALLPGSLIGRQNSLHYRTRRPPLPSHPTL
jgi:hypothetical protein